MPRETDTRRNRSEDTAIKPAESDPAASPLEGLERESALRPLLILAIPMVLLVLYGVLGD
jgi:hypothetical protein